MSVSYSPASPLLASATITAAEVQNWFASLNPKAPDGLGAAIVTEATAAGLDPVIVAAQIDLETAAWTSAFAVQRNNPAGLGAVDNNPNAALTFPTIRAGIHAQCAHLLTYIKGADNPFKADDPRYQAVVDAGYAGTAHVIGDLGSGRWATDPIYAASIVTRANALLTLGASMTGRDPVAIWAPSSNFDQGRNGLVVDHITTHMTAGTDSLSWLRGAAGGSSNTNSSATYLLSRDGTLHQLVDEADTPYTDGNLLYNQSGISVEWECQVGEEFSEQQIQSGIALYARIARRQGWSTLTHPDDMVLPAGGPLGTANVIGHSQVPDPIDASLGGGVDHHIGCPGPLFPWQRVIGGANAILTGHTAGDPPLPTPDMETWRDPATGYVVTLGMLARYKQVQAALAAIDPNEVLLVVGHPTSNEYGIPGGTAQMFEHQTWRWIKGQSPQRFDILAVTINPFDASKGK